MLYMVTFTINIPPMLACIPYMDPMGIVDCPWFSHQSIHLVWGFRRNCLMTAGTRTMFLSQSHWHSMVLWYSFTAVQKCRGPSFQDVGSMMFPPTFRRIYEWGGSVNQSMEWYPPQIEIIFHYLLIINGPGLFLYTQLYYVIFSSLTNWVIYHTLF